MKMTKLEFAEAICKEPISSHSDLRGKFNSLWHMSKPKKIENILLGLDTEHLFDIEPYEYFRTATLVGKWFKAESIKGIIHLSCALVRIATTRMIEGKIITLDELYGEGQHLIKDVTDLAYGIVHPSLSLNNFRYTISACRTEFERDQLKIEIMGNTNQVESDLQENPIERASRPSMN